MPIRKPTWSKATCEQIAAFKEHLETQLFELDESVNQANNPILAACLECEDVHCKEKEHSEVRDSHMLDILSAVIES